MFIILLLRIHIYMKIISVIVINYQNVELNTLYGSQNVITNHSNYPLDTSDEKIGFCSPPEVRRALIVR